MSSATYQMEKGQREGTKAHRHEGTKGIEPLAPGSAGGAKRTEPVDGAAASANPKSLGPWPFTLTASLRRLEVEAIYDAMAASSGKIPRQHAATKVHEAVSLDLNKSGDRMIYVLSNGRSPAGLGEDVRKMFAIFGYDPSGESLPTRDTSTTSAQALFWLNSPLPKHFAGEFAKTLLKPADRTDEQRLVTAYLTALGRPPREAETKAMLGYLEGCEAQKLPREEAWKRLCLALYTCSEFRYLE